MPEQTDIDHLSNWVGKQDRGSDTITPELVKRLKATLHGYTPLAGDQGSQLPLGIHWCLAQPAVSHEGLGKDGHPARGGFLPPVPLPRRMWASSRVRFHGALRVGAVIERTSTIADIALKQSAASGPLVFVSVEHEYASDKETLITERQNIVYRQPSAYQQNEYREPETPQSAAVSAVTLTPDSTLLFRYSALTFNGHRIHYDQHYATVEEGYPALVVQGPLTATLLMNLAQAHRPESTLQAFDFRAIAPAFVDEGLQLSINAGSAANDNEVVADTLIDLEARNQRGALIMSASAQFGGDAAQS